MIRRFKEFFTWLRYEQFECGIEPLPVCYPMGTARFVFSAASPGLVIWCVPNSIVSVQASPSREVTVELAMPVQAIGTMDAPDGVMLEQVYVDDMPMIIGGFGVPASTFDLGRTYTVRVPRWRVRRLPEMWADIQAGEKS